MANTMKFSKKAIDALLVHNRSSKSTEAEYTDSDTPGLKLCVTKSGRKYFRYRYTFKGEKLTMTFGDFGVITVEQARQKVLGVKRLLLDGIDPRQPTLVAAPVVTFRSFTENEYMQHSKKLKVSSKDDFFKLKNHMWPYFGTAALDAISFGDITKYLYHIEGKKLAPATLNRHRSLLSAIFKHAVLLGKLKKNPCTEVPKRKENNQRERYLNESEWARLLEVMEDTHPKTMERNRAIVDFMFICLTTGVRREEALNAKWQDIDLEACSWKLPVTKSGKARTVHLNEEAHARFEQMKRHPDTDYVFVNPKTKTRLVNPTKGVQRLLKRADIKNFRIHDCRHTFASMIVINGGSLYAVQKLLGHADPNTTQRYAHFGSEHLRQTSNLICKATRLAMRQSKSAA